MNASVDNNNVIVLPPDFIQKALEAIVSQVTAFTDSGKDYQIDGSMVEQTDCAAIQLLIVCQKYRSERQTSGSIPALMSAASDVLLDAMQQVGAYEFINSGCVESADTKQLQA
ncbi:MAG: hypothetical protein V3U65_14135 [Granulosicoccaceae bacterium]